jgi:Dyp-type peroxidase family
MVLSVAHKEAELAIAASNNIMERANEFIDCSFIELGRLRRDEESDDVISPLGFVDGISSEGSLIDRINTSLVRESWVPLNENISDRQPTYGSYMAFRKIRVSLAKFEERIAELANMLEGKDKILRAKALVMGRFPKGTPLALSGTALRRYVYRSGKEEMPFDYSDDTMGNKCPMGAHIRRANPREGGNVLSPILRRGYSFGVNGGDDEGLLFISFQRSIENQFEPLFKSGTKNTSPDLLTYLDGGANDESVVNSVRYPTSYNSSERTEPFTSLKKDVIQFRGGEFFFMPSLYYLKNILLLTAGRNT